MRLYLGAQSSLELIRHLRSINGPDGLEGAILRKRQMNDAINTARGINELDASAQFLLGQVSRPIHAFVCDRSMKANTKALVTHTFSRQIPSGCFLDLGHGLCVCTPQFAFLQLGVQNSPLELLKVGMELCGTFSRPPIPSSPASGFAEEGASCTYGLPPVMHARHLRLFVERMAGQRGAVNARKAVKYLVDGAASPMEAAIYLMLCLPKRVGGYGLPKPTLNPKIIIKDPTGATTIERYPDLFWGGANIDVEYNSDESHSGEWSRYRDSRREVELTVADVRVLPLTRHQLMDADGFDEFAQGLRRMLGIRTRPEDPQWQNRRGDLRRALLSADGQTT